MLKRLFNFPWIKENLALILLVPTVLGGFWQLTELAYIGVPYIRFFSVTQLVSDGLMMLFVLSIIFIMARITLKDVVITKIRRLPATNQPQKTPLTRRQKRNIIINMLVNAAFLALFVYIYRISIPSPVTSRNRVYTFEIALTFFGIFVAMICIRGIFQLSTDIIPYQKWKQKRAYQLLFPSVLMIGFFFCLKALIYLIPLIHRSYLLPEDLKNSDYIDCQVKRNNPGLKSFRIAYFNDKYIFLELTDQKDSIQTEVMKFDNFFSDTACRVKPAEKVTSKLKSKKDR